MDDKVVFVRTAVGRAAAVGNVGTQLAPPLRILLALINGKTALDELRRKVSDQIPADRLRAAIDVLLSHGYVDIARHAAPEDNDLDFTRLNSAELVQDTNPESHNL